MPTEEEMQEKLQNMSPEEMQEFQKENCIFCQIISGKVASKKIYEDEKCIGILDINPANPGHILLMPKEHYAIMPLIPEDTLKHLFMISKQLSATLLKALQAQGTNIFVANGTVAGQKAQHFMIHIIPRMENDGIKLDIKGNVVDDKSLEELRKVLVAKISKDLGITPEETVAGAETNVSEPKGAETGVLEPKGVKENLGEAKVEIKPEEEKKPTKKKPEKKSKADEIKEALGETSEEPEEKPVEEEKQKKIEKKSSDEDSSEEVSLDDIANLITGA